MPYIAMAHIVHIVMGYIVMAYIVTAYIVVDRQLTQSGNSPGLLLCHAFLIRPLLDNKITSHN